ncbi:hypothetical protein [Cytobacillus oceanisediminis]|uniref:hypothetical protein n=1 Tax=Cytobacillus oceanisediminis TaxID=665099 RepID=UPI00207A658A|nr:hypothetical protein [Cytobacillus oceanisediminis]MBY0157292.1 hypothetical protein [Cytobacillus firmus]USK46257.1 hypothetical protein LIT27_10545 [Cytobacillus oceanisediminis]
MSIYKNEKSIIEDKMWEIVLRETGVEDDAGCDWFTIGDNTYIGNVDWLVSVDSEIAELINAINCLKCRLEFINYTSETFVNE